MTYEEAKALIREHLDYAGHAKVAALAAAIADATKEDARDGSRYRWLLSRGRDDRMEYVNNTETDMDDFIDEQIAKEPK
jgi:hypothetical protein